MNNCVELFVNLVWIWPSWMSVRLVIVWVFRLRIWREPGVWEMNRWVWEGGVEREMGWGCGRMEKRFIIRLERRQRIVRVLMPVMNRYFGFGVWGLRV